MNIKEAEKTTGVSVRNIRFYEQKGLLSPARNLENDYREYSDADIQRLQLIRALRMVDMPLESVRQVLDGDTSLRIAATIQKAKLEEQIKHLQVTIKFCEELSETEPERISEVLRCMDEPENKKMLSKKWPTDYADTFKRVMRAILAGTRPYIVNALCFLPADLCIYYSHGYALFLVLLMLFSWYRQGVRMCQSKNWIQNLLLFFVLPVAGLVMAVCSGTMRGYADDPGGWLALGRLFFVPYVAVKDITSVKFSMALWEYFLWFGISTGLVLLGALVQRLRVRRNQKGVSKWLEVAAKKPDLAMPVAILLLCAILLAPTMVINIGPAEKCYDPAQLTQKFAGSDNGWAKTKDGTVCFEITEEFAEIARFDEWELQRFAANRGTKVLTIGKSYGGIVPDLRFYANGFVQLHHHGSFLADVFYYRIPEGVIEALTEYVASYTIEETQPVG